MYIPTTTIHYLPKNDYSGRLIVLIVCVDRIIRTNHAHEAQLCDKKLSKEFRVKDLGKIG